MRAIEILHERINERLAFMHAKRRESLLKTVSSLLRGGKLWLTALGRSRAEDGHKHQIKAVDRLLGNEHLHDELVAVYRELTRMLVGEGSAVVLIVDTVEVRPSQYALSASLAFDGRAFPLLSMVTTRSKPNGVFLRRFLANVAAMLPRGSRPVFITDAGFQKPWFDAVAERGWDYIGRVRSPTQVFLDGEWQATGQVVRRAARYAKNLGVAPFPRSHPVARRLVLSKVPVPRHRKRRTRSGRVGRRHEDGYRGRAAKEPWLLATSLPCRPAGVVELFALRMQIEESFRDTKSLRWGWSLRHCGSRTHRRLEVLLAIGAIATYIQQTIGRAAEQRHIHRRFQANTERRRRVLSLFLLGRFVLGTPGIPLPPSSVVSAIREPRRKMKQFRSIAFP